MKRIFFGLALVSLSAFAASCGAPAANTTVTNVNANANSNMNKPAAAAPTTESMMAMEKAANEAWTKSDTKWFQDNVSAKFVMYMGDGTRMDKDAAIKMVGSSKCDVKTYDFTEPAMSKINDDTYAITYKATFDGTCTMGGKTEKLPSPVRAASVVSREGGKWMAVFHGENMIIDPKNPPSPPAKTDDKKASDTKPAANANSGANSNTSSTNSNSSPAAPAKSANNEALAALHSKGWEAFRNKDAKWFESGMTENMTFVDPIGGVQKSRADAIKQWTETMKCEGITKTSFTEAVATSVSPTVEILTGKGTADGICDGQKNGPIYQTAVYVKEGDAWKLAFMFESLPM